MTTHISKIGRLPHKIREELNRRLHNGELGRKILKWLNSLPETKEILDDLFAGKPVTHQNLSEWRHGGYHEWLLHQQRLEWFDRLNEQEDELQKHDDRHDTYEAFGRLLIVEIGQAFAALQNIKNPEARWERLQNLTREFARLQNAYNWSRRVRLEWDKYNDQFEPSPAEPEPSDSEDHARARVSCSAPSPNVPLNSQHKTLSTVFPPDSGLKEIRESSPESPTDEPLSAPATHHASPVTEPSTLNTKPPQLSTPAARPVESEKMSRSAIEIPEHHNEFQAIPTYSAPAPAPAPPAPRTPRPPIRGRRFVCVEG